MHFRNAIAPFLLLAITLIGQGVTIAIPKPDDLLMPKHASGDVQERGIGLNEREPEAGCRVGCFKKRDPGYDQ
ncbi:MAG: hypothetical protein M1840_008707 [Geoglossum simile]|nr:MAG: hypothetical protein M1840_008707 [Geoglossum simile]